MGPKSSPGPTMTPFGSGMPKLVPQSAILSRGTPTGCRALLTLQMGATSSPDPTITPFEPGMLRLVLQPAIISRGARARFLLILRLATTSILGLDPTITPLEPGMRRLVLQPASISRGARCSLLLTLRTGTTSFLGLVTTLPVHGTHFHLLSSDVPLVARSILNFLQRPIWRVGSGTQRVVYYTGYHTTVVQPFIHPPL